MPIHDRADYVKMVRDEYLTDRGYLRVQTWTDPVAADADRILNDQATSNSVVTTVTSFLAQPDFPRNITITPGGTTADVPAGDVVVTGTNIRDEVITENITLTANQSTIATGSKAFKTVTSIVFPTQDGAAATYDVGVGDKLGLDRKMPANFVLQATADGVRETTFPTVAFSATAVESNTVDLNTALNASVDVKVVYVTTEVVDDNNTTS